MRKAAACLMALVLAFSLCSCATLMKVFQTDRREENTTAEAQHDDEMKAEESSAQSPTEQTSRKGTRTHPIKVGETATYDGSHSLFYRFKADLTVTAVVRGAEAANLVKEANQFNDTPPAGKEYLLVKFRIKVTESSDDKKVDINNALFQFVSAGGVEYNDFVSIAGLKPSLTGVYAGGEMEGYAYSMIDSGDHPLVIFLEGHDGSLWFATQ